MNKDKIKELEQLCGSVNATYRTLGISRASWARHKAADQIPSDVAASVRAHLALAPSVLERLVQRHGGAD